MNLGTCVIVWCTVRHHAHLIHIFPDTRSASQTINMQRSRLFSIVVTPPSSSSTINLSIRTRVEPHACATLSLCTNTTAETLLVRDSCVRSALIFPSFRLQVVSCTRNVFCRSISFAFDWSPNEYNIYEIVVYNAIWDGMWVNFALAVFWIKCIFVAPPHG